ncbi:MAG TPA: hypothetical protein VMU93_08655 [Caulobacteraceae bacterium]|nr:hypothetical protein [Caulobacteraceae bacterium]
MQYSAEWSDDALNAAPEERATVADLRLWLGEQNVTLHVHGLSIIDHLTISLYSLAEGLAHDWWRLFGGRDREFSLVGYRGGFVVPDIRFKFDGEVFEIAAHQRTYSNPDVRFWAGPTEVMRRADAETLLSGLIELVLSRLGSGGVEDTSAALRWARVRASRTNPEEAAFCEAAGTLGLDPYQIGEDAAASIEQAAVYFEGEPLTEFLAGAGAADRRRLIQWVESADARPPYTSRVSNLRSVAFEASCVAPPREMEESWALGYRRACAVRRILNLRASDRFRSFRPLAEKLGASRAYALAPSVEGIRALRSDHADAPRIHMRIHGSSPEARAGHLFSFARAIGDVACFPEESRAPINELRSAYRQAAGRAFAAEFLAPIDEIESMHEDGRDAVSIAEEFGVSTTVIERQRENKGRIQSALARR